MAQKTHPTGSLHTLNVADELATMQPPLEVVVVSPARPLHEGPAGYLQVKTPQGQLGIWPRHTDIVSGLGIGLVRVGLVKGGEERFAAWGGFLKVIGNKVTVLVDKAVREAEAKEQEPAIRQELDEVLAELRHPATDERFEELLDQRLWCQSRLKLAAM